MIKIEQRNGYWEAYVNGGLFHYSEDLGRLLEYLANHVESIKDELSE